MEFTLHEVVTAKDQILSKNISAVKKTALVEIAGEELQVSQGQEQALFSPLLTTTDYNCKGQMLFFIAYKMHAAESVPGRGNHKWTPIYKSEIKGTQSRSSPYMFQFNQFACLTSDLCGNDEEQECKFEFFISMKNGRHKNIGNALFTVRDLK